MVDTIASRVQVDPVRGSRLVNITFVAMDPKFAAVAINTLATEYVDQNLAVKQQATQNMLDWLEREKRAQQDKVEANDRALAEYRDKQNALSLDDKQNIVLSRLNQLNDAATKAKTARVQRESIYQQVASLPAGASPDSLPVIAQNATIQGLRSQLSVLQRQKAQLSERYGDKHPEIQKVNAQLVGHAAADPGRDAARARDGEAGVPTRRGSRSRRSADRSMPPKPTRRTSATRASTTTSWSARRRAIARCCSRSCSVKTS